MDVDESPSNPSNKRKREDFEYNNFQSLGIIYDKSLCQESDKHPRIALRSFAVFSLLEAYDLFKYFTILQSNPATIEDLCSFHSSDYIGYLKEINSSYTPDDEVELEFGLGYVFNFVILCLNTRNLTVDHCSPRTEGYDCPAIDGIFDYCCAIGGSTLTAARALLTGTCDVVINWFGGWHHAQRDEAEGFCYINDICIGILELRKVFDNILYFDFDIHHGNGVENAFSYTRRVMTISMHLYEPGFYPGTGSENDVGHGSGSYYSINVPLRNGTSDSTYIHMFDWLLSAILEKFTPDAIVVQCGADGLSGDPVGCSFNLSQKAYGHCLKQLMNLRKPTLILGGGGYHLANTSRCWAYLTSLVAGAPLSSDIPEHENFQMYFPSFELPVSTSLRKDFNSPEYISQLKDKITMNLQNI